MVREVLTVCLFHELESRTVVTLGEKGEDLKESEVKTTVGKTCETAGKSLAWDSESG